MAVRGGDAPCARPLSGLSLLDRGRCWHLRAVVTGSWPIGLRPGRSFSRALNIGSFNKPSGVGEADCDSVEHALCPTRNDVEM